jgi:hypothetical protein
VDEADDCSMVASILKEARQNGWNEADADDFTKNFGTMMSIGPLLCYIVREP